MTETLTRPGYAVEACLKIGEEMTPFVPMAHFGTPEEAEADAMRLVRGGGYHTARVRGPDGYLQEHRQPPYSPTSVVANVREADGWMVYGEMIPFNMLEASPEETRWELYTPQPVDCMALEGINDHLRQVIGLWGMQASISPTKDPATLRNWVGAKVVPAQLPTVPAAAASLPPDRPAEEVDAALREMGWENKGG